MPHQRPAPPRNPALAAESRQDALAFLAARMLGLTAEQADQLVGGMQARRRALLGVHADTLKPKSELRTVLLVE